MVYVAHLPSIDALSPGAYKCGQVWGIQIDVAGVSFYHQGSANLIDDAGHMPQMERPAEVQAAIEETIARAG